MLWGGFDEDEEEDTDEVQPNEEQPQVDVQPDGTEEVIFVVAKKIYFCLIFSIFFMI